MSSPQDPASLTAEQRALLALRRMRAKLDALEREKNEPIAIVGMGCRFPGGASSPEAFWQNLVQGRDAIGQPSSPRWEIQSFYDQDPDLPGHVATQWSGFLQEDAAAFDAAFFGLSPREVELMDPQQRLLLEVAWEALEHAGLPAERLAKSQSGVFIGICNLDYNPLPGSSPLDVDPYSSTGSAYSVAAGRLAYLLDLCGPALSVDTACSSSLVAMHLACQSLRGKECDLALAGGVNLILSPLPTVALAKWGMLSPDSSCKTFDAAANGFVRGEGCGLLVLKRLSDALAHGDQIYALIRGSAVNQDGHSNGLTAPNMQAQQAVIAAALQRAGVAPGEISYVEAHGTGTPLGDPIEVSALAAALGPRDADSPPCVIGSVKTNIGHLEAAAGVAGVIKAVLALQHEAIPPHLHFTQLNPNIAFGQVPFHIPTSLYPWPRSAHPRYAGISSFGFSGTNAHLIIEEPPAPSTARPAPPAALLLPISARTPEALVAQAQATRSFLACADDSPYAICATAGLRRTHHAYRMAACGHDIDSLCQSLEALIHAPPEPPPATRPKIVFLFAGQGAQWLGMGQQLYRSEQVFRSALDACADAMAPYLGQDLRHVLALSADEQAPADPPQPDLSSVLCQTRYAQPALFAFELAIAALWRSWGVAPDTVIGHSMGEVAAAYVAGALTLADAARVICVRGSVMQPCHGQGRMLATGLSHAQADELIASYGGRVAIAAINGPQSTVLAGTPEPIAAICQQLAARGVFCREMPMPYAFHSPMMDSILPTFSASIGHVEPQQPAIPIISTVTGRAIAGRELDQIYWEKNLRQPVLFEQALQNLPTDDPILIEIGPHPVLAQGAAQTCAAQGRSQRILAPLRHGQDDALALREALGELFRQGIPLDWSAIYPQPVPPVALPCYPWQRHHFWHCDALPYHPCAQPRHTAARHGDLSLIGSAHQSPLRPHEHMWEFPLDVGTCALLGQHEVGGERFLPATAYCELMARAWSQIKPSPFEIEHIQFHQALKLDAPALAQIILSRSAPGQHTCQLFSRAPSADEPWVLHATAQLRPAAEQHPAAMPIDRQAIAARTRLSISKQQHYAAFAQRGFCYGPLFQGIEDVWLGDREVLARIVRPAAADSSSRSFDFAFLDALLQPIAHVLPEAHAGYTYLPVRIDQLSTHGALPQEVWSHARLQDSRDGILTVELCCFDAQGHHVLSAQSIQFLAAALPSMARWHPKWVHAPQWNEIHLPAAAAEPGTWLLLADRRGIAHALQSALEALGQQVILVLQGPHCQQIDRHTYQIGESATDTQWLIQQAWATAKNRRGVIHLGNCDLVGALSAESVESAIIHGTSSLLWLVQSLQACPAPGSLWVITQGAQAPVGPETLHMVQAAAWGLGRVAQDELPELGVRCLDLAPAEQADANQLAAALLAAPAERQLSIRQGRCHALQILPYDTPLAPRYAVRPDRTYLITGGLGGIGMEAARWLVDQGARSLVLVGRHVPDAAARQRVAALRAQGAQVLTANVDVTSADSVAALIDMIRIEQAPLCAIIHAAGVLDDGLLVGLDHQRLWQVCAPKILGAWHLHQASQGLPLDSFVVFSSAATLLGSPGQGSYVAANAMLDSFAAGRSASGLPALSINWGPWLEVGMAARSHVEDRLAARGLLGIAPEQGVLALSHAMGQPQAQLGIFPQADQAARPAGDLRPADTMPSEAQPWEREADCAAFVCAQVARIVKLPQAMVDLDTAFQNLGFDSLMSLELRSRVESQFAVALPVNFIWEHPTVGAVVDYLEAALEPGSSVAR